MSSPCFALARALANSASLMALELFAIAHNEVLPRPCLFALLVGDGGVSDNGLGGASGGPPEVHIFRDDGSARSSRL